MTLGHTRISILGCGHVGTACDVALSTPCIVGDRGVEAALELQLNEAEHQALKESAAILQHAYSQLGSA